MRHPGRRDYSPINNNRRNSDLSTGSSVEMENMGPSTTTTLATTTSPATAAARAVVNVPAVGQPDLSIPGIQNRSDMSPSSAESGEAPSRFVIIGGAGSMNQFDLSPAAQWDFDQEPNRAAASLRLCIWAMFLFACLVMFRVQQDKLAQAMANRRSNVLHLVAPWEKTSFNDRNSSELRAVYIDPRLATVASNLRLGQNHELDVAQLLPPRANSYIRELDSQRLVASVLDGTWRSTTYGSEDNESIEEAASPDVATLRSVDRTQYSSNKGVAELCPIGKGNQRSCMMALLKDNHEGFSCFHLAAAADGGVTKFDVSANDSMVCLGDKEGAEVVGQVESALGTAYIRALLPDRFSDRIVYIWRPVGDEQQGFAPSIDCVTTVDSATGKCIDSVPIHSASYYGIDFHEGTDKSGKATETTKVVSITYDYQRWQSVLRSYVMGADDSPMSSRPEFKSILFTSRGPFWVVDSPDVSDGFVLVVAGTEPQIGILHATPLYDAQIGPANQWMKQGDVLRRENTRSAYYRHMSGKMADETVAEVQRSKARCFCGPTPSD